MFVARALTAFLLFVMLSSTAAFADEVTGIVAGGTLKLKGDADGNDIALDQAALSSDEIRVTGTGTTVNGANSEVFGNVSGVQIDLGAGDNTLTIDTVTLAGALSIKTGGGADTVTANASDVGDKLKVNLGQGDDVLNLCGVDVFSTIDIKTGDGPGTQRSGECTTPLLVAGSAFGNVFVLEDVTSGGKFSLKGSKAVDAVFSIFLEVGESAKVKLGAGSNAFGLCLGQVGESLTVDMGTGSAGAPILDCDDGAITGHAEGNTSFLALSTQIGERFTFKSGGGDDGATLVNTQIGSGAKLDLGQGTNVLNASTVGVGEGFTLKAGKGPDTATIDQTNIGESATINFGAGSNSIALTQTHIVENMTVKTGNDDDTIDLAGATVDGSLKIKNGKGNDTVTVP